MLIARIDNTLCSPQRVQRIVHFVLAACLYNLPPSVRKSLFAGKLHYCPICGSDLRSFLRLHRPYHLWCPVCRSLQRHRLLWLFLQRRTDLFDLSAKRMLHVAPEPALASRFKCIANLDYLSADLDARAAMVKMDICEIHCPDNTFDVICCSHVLEHVPDDRRAMREFWRVLKSQGWAVILVPITAPKTFEDTSVANPRERERLFGQYDHVRCYGPDFGERLEAAGFRVTRTMTEDLVTDPDEAHYLGVSANETIFLCEK